MALFVASLVVPVFIGTRRVHPTPKDEGVIQRGIQSVRESTFQGQSVLFLVPSEHSTADDTWGERELPFAAAIVPSNGYRHDSRLLTNDLIVTSPYWMVSFNTLIYETLWFMVDRKCINMVIHMTLPRLIDFLSPSEEAVCLHEAGHAFAALVVEVSPASMEIYPGPPPFGRNSIPLSTGSARRMMACGGYAVELNLFNSGRLVDANGELITQQQFIQQAIGQNGARDKTIFFEEDRADQNGVWPGEDDQKFMANGSGLADLICMPCVEALAEALLNDRKLERDQIVAIGKRFLPNVQ
jgi:hypothetical protein